MIEELRRLTHVQESGLYVCAPFFGFWRCNNVKNTCTRREHVRHLIDAVIRGSLTHIYPRRYYNYA